MSTEREKSQEVYIAALEIHDVEAREEYIAATCGGNVALLALVRRLIAEHDSEAPTLQDDAEILDQGEQSSSETEYPGEEIGNYRLVEKLGEGGFGTVWRAEQSEPVQRQVALKIIKLGMDTREVIARFEQERQALAFMDHPSIAHAESLTVATHRSSGNGAVSGEETSTQ